MKTVARMGKYARLCGLLSLFSAATAWAQNEVPCHHTGNEGSGSSVNCSDVVAFARMHGLAPSEKLAGHVVQESAVVATKALAAIRADAIPPTCSWDAGLVCDCISQYEETWHGAKGLRSECGRAFGALNTEACQRFASEIVGAPASRRCPPSLGFQEGTFSVKASPRTSLAVVNEWPCDGFLRVTDEPCSVHQIYPDICHGIVQGERWKQAIAEAAKELSLRDVCGWDQRNRWVFVVSIGDMLRQTSRAATSRILKGHMPARCAWSNRAVLECAEAQVAGEFQRLTGSRLPLIGVNDFLTMTVLHGADRYEEQNGQAQVMGSDIRRVLEMNVADRDSLPSCVGALGP